MTKVVGVFLAINAVLYVLTYLMQSDPGAMLVRLALWFPGNENFEWWQFVTSMFMHNGPAHLIFNMFALWSFGTVLETIWGSRRFLIFYFVAGIGSGVIFTAVNWFEFRSAVGDLVQAGVSENVIRAWLKTNYFPPGNYSDSVIEGLRAIQVLYHGPAVGASGAIYGVLVAFGFMFPNAKLMLMFLPVPVAAKYFIPALLAIDLFFGLTGFSVFGLHIAHFAHLGGAVIGFVFMWVWREKLRREVRARQVVADGPPG